MQTKNKLRTMIVWVGMALPAAAQYAGPAILSRGEAPSAMNRPQIDFRPFVGLTAGYSTGLAGVGVAETGNIPDFSSSNVTLSWGLSGTHSWRRTKVGLNYSGSLTHYANQSHYDALNHSPFLLSITHQVSRHTVLSISQTGGVFSRDSGLRGLQQTVPFDPSTSYIPTQDYFDNRTTHMNTQAHLSMQRSTRLSLGISGGYFYVGYRSKALTGVQGYTAAGDIQYRVSRRVTLGTSYNFGHYSFRRVFGGTDYHAVAGTFGMGLTRTLEISGYAGAARVESTFTRTVPLDPVIVALLGITTGTEVVHSVTYIPNYAVRLSRTFQTGVLSASIGHSVIPGNGLFLTSHSTNIIGGYSYTGLRRWSLGAYVNHAANSAVGDVIGKYSTTTGGLSMARRLIGSVHFMANASLRNYGSQSFSKYNRLVSDVSVGFGFTPGDIPLRMW